MSAPATARYVVTEFAGELVAGQLHKGPGSILKLTEAAARYELLLRAIYPEGGPPPPPNPEPAALLSDVVPTWRGGLDRFPTLGQLGVALGLPQGLLDLAERVAAIEAGAPIGTPQHGIQFVQATPSASWIVPHTLGRLPNVAVYSLTGAEFLADVHATALTVNVVFATPTAGRAVLT